MQRRLAASEKAKTQLEKENKMLLVTTEETLTAMESNTETLAKIIETIIDKFDKISKDSNAWNLPGLKKASSVPPPPAPYVPPPPAYGPPPPAPSGPPPPAPYDPPHPDDPPPSDT